MAAGYCDFLVQIEGILPKVVGRPVSVYPGLSLDHGFLVLAELLCFWKPACTGRQPDLVVNELRPDL